MTDKQKEYVENVIANVTKIQTLVWNINCKLINATQTGNLNDINVLMQEIQNEPLLKDVISNVLTDCFDMACRLNNAEMAKVLLENGAYYSSLTRYFASKKETVLMLCDFLGEMFLNKIIFRHYILEGNYEVIEALIEHSYKLTPIDFHNFPSKEQGQILDLLLTKVETQLANKNLGFKILDYLEAIVWSRDPEKKYIDLYLNKGGDINERDEWGKTILEYAVFNENVDFVTNLLKYNPDLMDSNGEKLLIKYYKSKKLLQKNHEIIKLLNNAGIKKNDLNSSR